MDWFLDRISTHPFVFLVVPLSMVVALLLVRDRLLRISGLPKEEWPQYFTSRPITPASNKRGLFVLCACGLGEILIGLYEEHYVWGKVLRIGAGFALVIMAFFIYRKTQRDIERAVTTPIDPNHPSGGAM
jgi:hypothetical protein